MTKAKKRGIRNCRAWLLFWTLLFAATLQLDLPRLFKVPRHVAPPAATFPATVGTTAPAADAKSDATPQAFLVRQYDAALKEIQTRLEQEDRLFVLKFTLVGAILAVLFTCLFKGDAGKSSQPLMATISRSPVAAAICWAATLTCAVVDSRALYHADAIFSLGSWIRTQVEPSIYGSVSRGWETYAAEQGAFVSARSYAFQRVNTSLLTYVLFALTTVVFSIRRFGSDRTTNGVRTLGTVGSWGLFALFFLNASHFLTGLDLGLTGEVVWPCVFGFLALLGGIFASYYWSRLPSDPDSIDRPSLFETVGD